MNLPLRPVAVMFLGNLLLSCACFAAGDTSAPATTAPDRLHLLPVPVKTTLGEGTFDVGRAAILIEGRASAPNEFAAGLVQEEAKRWTGRDLKVVSRVEGGTLPIIIGLLGDIDLDRNRYDSEPIGEQGYILDVQNDRVVVTANTEVGLFYGCQTLKQMIRADSTDGKIPCVTIVDHPALLYRGVSWDVSRGPIPTMETAKWMIRMMSEFKINMLTLYTEHVFKLKKHPSIAPPDAFTAEQITELAEYAGKYHVDLVGNFQSFAHQINILRRKQYVPLSETWNRWSFAPANEATYAFLDDVYSEIVPAYRSKFFFINCDEVDDLGGQQSKEMAQKLGLGGLGAYHVNRICDLLKPYGVRAMMWHDLGYNPENAAKLPKDVVLCYWHYDRSEYKDALQPLMKGGHDFFVCPCIRSHGSVFPSWAVGRRNMKGLIRDGIACGAMGVMNTIWHDAGEEFDMLNCYGIIYGAAMSWGNTGMEDAEFDRRYPNALYGARDDAIARAERVLEGTHTETTNWLYANYYSTYVPLYIHNMPEPFVRPKPEAWKWYFKCTPEEYEKKYNAVIALLEQAKPNIKASPYADVLDYMIFAAKRLRFLAHRYKTMHEVKKLLDPRVNIYTVEDMELARRKVGTLTDELTALRDEYRELWLRENRPDHLNCLMARWWDPTIQNYKQFSTYLLYFANPFADMQAFREMPLGD